MRAGAGGVTKGAEAAGCSSSGCNLLNGCAGCGWLLAGSSRSWAGAGVLCAAAVPQAGAGAAQGRAGSVLLPWMMTLISLLQLLVWVRSRLMLSLSSNNRA